MWVHTKVVLTSLFLIHDIDGATPSTVAVEANYCLMAYFTPGNLHPTDIPAILYILVLISFGYGHILI